MNPDTEWGRIRAELEIANLVYTCARATDQRDEAAFAQCYTEDGEILSGTFSPTIGKAIAFARIPAGEPGEVRVDIRGKEVPVRVVKFPFVRDGKVQDGI